MLPRCWVARDAGSGRLGSCMLEYRSPARSLDSILRKEGELCWFWFGSAPEHPVATAPVTVVFPDGGIVTVEEHTEAQVAEAQSAASIPPAPLTARPWRLFVSVWRTGGDSRSMLLTKEHGGERQ